MIIEAFQKLETLYKSLPASNCWIAGGALRSALLDEPIKDIDIFTDDFARTKREFIESGKFNNRQENDDVINFYKEDTIYQLVKRYQYANEKDTIDDFDFTCVAAAIGPNGITLHERFFLDNAQRRLVIVANQRPLIILRRIIKYIGMGYVISPREFSKVIENIKGLDMDFKNPDHNPILYYSDGNEREDDIGFNPTDIINFGSLRKISSYKWKKAA